MKPTVEQLLAALENKERKKRVENNKTVLRYVEETGLEPGTALVPNYLIFYHYRAIWQGIDRHFKTNKIVFFRTFNKRFPHYRQGRQRYYLLKEGVIPMDDQTLKDALTYDKKFWAKKEKAVQPSP